MDVLTPATDVPRTTAGLPKADDPRGLELGAPALRFDGLGRASQTLLGDITPARISSTFQAAERNVAQQIELAVAMEESDDHLNATLELRRASVLRLERHVEPGDADDPTSQEAADAAEEIVSAAWFHHLCDWLLRAVWHQWAAAEIRWSVSAARWTPIGYRAVEPARWHFDRDGNPQLMRRIGNISDLLPPTAGKFATHTYASVYGQPGKYAKVRAIAKLWFLLRLDMIGWGEMIDSWASPFVHFQYDETIGEERIQSVIDRFLELAARKCAATPTGVNLTMHDVPDQSPHERFQDFGRRAISRYLLGQDSSQTAIEGQTTGATLQGDVRDDVRDMDARLLDTSINETLLAPWCAWNFGPEVAPPRLVHRIREERDPEQTARVIAAAQQAGLRVPLDWAYRSLGIPQPDAQEPVLMPIPPAPARMFGARFVGRDRAEPGPTETGPTEKTGLEGVSTAVRAAAEKAGSFEEFLGGVQEAVFGAGVDDEALRTAVLGAFAAGRLEEAERIGGRGSKETGRSPAPQRLAPQRLAPQRLAPQNQRRARALVRGSGTAISVLAGELTRARLTEAIDQLGQRTDVMPKPEFLKLHGQARARAWTVARVAELDVLRDLRAAVGQAVEGGQTFREFRDSLNTVMETRGWGGLEPWHAKLVYTQNVAMAHSAGRSTQARDAGATLWRKLPSDSVTPRSEHARYDGQVFSFGDMTPPPWGFGCKCNWEPVLPGEEEAPTAEIRGPADRPPGAEEFEWDAGHYFRPLTVRRGEYPRELWPLIDAAAQDTNALLKVTQ